MEQILHGSARTTEAIRRAIQHSQASLKILAARHGINLKTVAKWRGRTDVHDAVMGPKDARSRVLTPAQEATIVAFWGLTLYQPRVMRLHDRRVVSPHFFTLN